MPEGHSFARENNPTLGSEYLFGRHEATKKGKKSLFKLMRLAHHIHQHRLEVEKLVNVEEAKPVEPAVPEDGAYVARPEVQELYGSDTADVEVDGEWRECIRVASCETSKGCWRAFKLHDREPVLFQWACNLDKRDAYPFNSNLTRTPRERAILNMLLRRALVEAGFESVADGIEIPETPGVVCELHCWYPELKGATNLWETLARVTDEFAALGK